jgi:hypothetical protein
VGTTSFPREILMIELDGSMKEKNSRNHGGNIDLYRTRIGKLGLQAGAGDWYNGKAAPLTIMA